VSGLGGERRVDADLGVGVAGLDVDGGVVDPGLATPWNWPMSWRRVGCWFAGLRL
jgi:hypothetical protein